MTGITKTRVDRVLQTLSNLQNLSPVSAPAAAENEAAHLTNGSLQCRPWDIHDYRRRIESFKPTTWFAKPISVSPCVCALYGFVNSAKDTLSCEICRTTLTFDFPSEDIQEQEAAARQFVEQLATSHTPLCPWLNNPCLSSFAELPTDKEELKNGFTQRRLALLGNNDEPLPKLDVDSETCFYSASIRRPYGEHPAFAQLFPSSASPSELTASVLAICGWSRGSTAAGPCLVCLHCQSKVLLHNVAVLKSTSTIIPTLPDTNETVGRKRKHSTEESTALQEPPAKWRYVATTNGEVTLPAPGDTFDPLREHRWYCPWIHTPHRGRLAGWERTLATLFEPLSNVEMDMSVEREHEGMSTASPTKMDFTSMYEQTSKALNAVHKALSPLKDVNTLGT